jgi:hypothetical protein
MLQALLAAALLHATGALFAAGAVATPSTGPRVGVLWFGVDLQQACSIDVPGVEREVRRIFEAMGVEIDWKVPATPAVHQGQEIVVVALPKDALNRTRLMGATARGSSTVWVYCSEVAGTLGLDPRTPGSAPLLSQAVGRVVAHEIVHALAPALPHAVQGLMASRWAPSRLLDPILEADAATRRAIQRLLAK